DRQVHLAGDKLVGRQHLLDGDDLLFLVGYLDSDSAFARYRSDDPDAQGGKTQRDIVLQALDPGNPDARFGDDLIEGNGGPDGSPDLGNLDFVVEQCGNDLILVGLHFSAVNLDLVIRIVEQQLQGWGLIAAQIERGIVGYAVLAVFLDRKSVV